MMSSGLIIGWAVALLLSSTAFTTDFVEAKVVHQSPFRGRARASAPKAVASST